MQADLFNERESWRGPLLLSAGLHVLLATALIVVGIWKGQPGENWGGTSSGDAVSANLISSIPLPPAQTQTQNIVANDSKGTAESTPQKKVEEDTTAIPIPDKTVKRKIEPTHTTATADVRPRPIPTPTPTPSNTVPFGQGGPVSGPYGVFSAAHAKGGFSVQGGDFGSRFPYYVDAVRRKVAENWFEYEVSSSAEPRRVYLQFDIRKDGTPDNVRLMESSNIPSLDQSATRAIQRIDTFGRLPDGYSGSKVSVEFWFDYHR
ncbi:MAG TPA: TonB family protein [Candidatus Angelobacter sp.]|nr:TonB family protein [Candidatus Angelobacter sp.]